MSLCTLLTWCLSRSRGCSAELLAQWPAAGCDALAVHLIIGAVACSLAIGVSWKAVVGTLGIMIPWQLAHWEEYHSGMDPSLAKELSGQIGASSQGWSVGVQLRYEGCCPIVRAWTCSVKLCLLHPLTMCSKCCHCL